MKAQLPWALEEADLSFCLQGATAGTRATRSAPHGGKQRVPTVDALVAASSEAARPGDHVLCMSNGGFGGIHGKLLAALRAKFALRLARDARRSPTCLPARIPLVAESFKGRTEGRMVGAETRPDCSGGAHSCRHRRARRWPWSSRAWAQWPPGTLAGDGQLLGGFYATVVAEAPAARPCC
jgi:hypothetical protein